MNERQGAVRATQSKPIRSLLKDLFDLRGPTCTRSSASTAFSNGCHIWRNCTIRMRFEWHLNEVIGKQTIIEFGQRAPFCACWAVILKRGIEKSGWPFVTVIDANSRCVRWNIVHSLSLHLPLSLIKYLLIKFYLSNSCHILQFVSTSRCHNHRWAFVKLLPLPSSLPHEEFIVRTFSIDDH